MISTPGLPADLPTPELPTPDLRGHTVLALHAHPDDEAIFTGITLRRLADAGARTVLVVATAGELGDSRVPLRPGETVPERRVAELEQAAALLRVSRLVLLGRRDSGLPGSVSGNHARALAAADPLLLARTVAEIADDEGACALVHDDEHGIYGHPDHRATFRIGATAADLVGVTSYRTTVDREHLHVSARDRHLVHGAARAAAVAFGRVTAEIGLAVTGTPEHLASKRAAMVAHASQIDASDVPETGFADAYGYEWYRRSGEAGPLDALGNAHLVAPIPA
ncbi:PIG-L family deacetylase [Pseudonocardia aurantiaca]|uniref:PIG-L deacetylase family protein n=1 Tax=Pseudonocardia aurantiaca TaxID=75290 RepID=A0ABW4FGK4_9PSEU